MSSRKETNRFRIICVSKYNIFCHGNHILNLSSIMTTNRSCPFDLDFDASTNRCTILSNNCIPITDQTLGY